MPPVWSCTAVTPAAAMVTASTSESMSASMTPMDRRSRSRSAVRVSSVVLPDPGLLMTLSRNVPRSRRSRRRSSALRSLAAKADSFTSMTRTVRASAALGSPAMGLLSFRVFPKSTGSAVDVFRRTVNETKKP